MHRVRAYVWGARTREGRPRPRRGRARLDAGTVARRPCGEGSLVVVVSFGAVRLQRRMHVPCRAAPVPASEAKDMLAAPLGASHSVRGLATEDLSVGGLYLSLITSSARATPPTKR